MPYKQSKKAQMLLQSEIRNMSIECDKVNGINLSQGICDLPLDSILSKSAYQAMTTGQNHYTQYNGIELLREQISRKANEFNHINATPDNVTISCGATGALYSACYALFDPGDEVILFEPFYGYHEYTLLSLNLTPVFATLQAPDWIVDFDELDRLVTSKTKAIVICTPSNPCGKVFSRSELEGLGNFCIKYDLIALTDEIYEYITYDGCNHISPASLPEFAGRTVTVSGYSKTFSITGWRLGYCITDKSIAKWVGNANDMIYVCAPAPLQYGVAEGIRAIPDSFYASLKQDFQIKRDMLCDTLANIGMTPHIPQGAYYVLADSSNIPGKTSKERAMHILSRTGVGVVPGDAFFHSSNGTKLVRFCFAKDMPIISKACELLKQL